MDKPLLSVRIYVNKDENNSNVFKSMKLNSQNYQDKENLFKKFLNNSHLDQICEESRKTFRNLYTSIIGQIINKKSYNKGKSSKFIKITKDIKKNFIDKNFPVRFINKIIHGMLKNEFHPNEILNEISFIYNIKKTLEFYSSKSIKDLILRSIKVNREEVPDSTLRYIYFEYKTINEEAFLNENYKTLRSLIDGPQQLRRPLDSDYGYYRYIPIRCKNFCYKSYSEFHEILSNDHNYKHFIKNLNSKEVSNLLSELKLHFLKNCIFSHNINEISYHPLKYKIKYCKNGDCSYSECPSAHLEINEELIKIFNIQLFENIKFDLEHAQNPVKNNKAIEEETNEKDSFNHKNQDYVGTSSIKINECDKKALCDNFKTCNNYHSLLERRRNPLILQITNNKPCERVFVNKKWLTPDNCGNKDSCKFFHTRNELFYDSRNFKRIYECYIEKNKGVCENANICPYKHLIDIDVKTIYLPENEKSKINELINEYNQLTNVSRNLNKKIATDNFICQNCKKYIKEKIIVFKCGHNCCKNCVNIIKDCYFECLNKQDDYIQSEKDYHIIDLSKRKNNLDDEQSPSQSDLSNISKHNIEDCCIYVNEDMFYFKSKHKIKDFQENLSHKQETITNFVNLLKTKNNSINSNCKININLRINNLNQITNNYSTNIYKNAEMSQEDKEKIQQLDDQIKIMKMNVSSLEEEKSRIILEHNNLKDFIALKMSEKDFTLDKIKSELNKFSDLERNIDNTKEKINSLNNLIDNCTKKLLNHENNFKELDEKYLKRIAELEKQYLFLNDQKEDIFIKKFNEVEKELNKLKLDHSIKACNDIDFSVPHFWKPQTENLVITELGKNTTEYNSILLMFSKTMTKSKIIKITRIQNLELWKIFCFSKYQLSKKGNNDSKLLFHGTRQTEPSLIYAGKEEGFDMRFAKEGYFGIGIYFHEKASYSHNYSFISKSKTRTMLIADVLTGESFLSANNQTLRLPPFKDENNKIRYDSVKADYDEIYVLYNNMRAYPKYLIEYIR